MTKEVTNFLRRWGDGDRQALDELFPLVYSELNRIAAAYLSKERREHTLQTSALVHEAYVKLIDQDRVQWRNRSQFFAIASQIMRRFLVDYARGRGSSKRGGGAILLALDDALVLGPDTDPAVLALDGALVELKAMDPDLCELIELRFFGGLGNEEIAEFLGVSSRTVIRRWRTARAWLHHYLTNEEAGDAS